MTVSIGLPGIFRHGLPIKSAPITPRLVGFGPLPQCRRRRRWPGFRSSRRRLFAALLMPPAQFQGDAGLGLWIECDAVAVLHAVPDIAEHCTSGPDGFEVNIQDFFARDPAPMQHGAFLASWNLVDGNLHAALLTLCRVDHMKMACKLRLAKHMGKGLDGCHETDLLHLHYYYLLKTLAGRSLIFKTLTK